MAENHQDKSIFIYYQSPTNGTIYGGVLKPDQYKYNQESDTYETKPPLSSLTISPKEAYFSMDPSYITKTLTNAPDLNIQKLIDTKPLNDVNNQEPN